MPLSISLLAYTGRGMGPFSPCSAFGITSFSDSTWARSNKPSTSQQTVLGGPTDTVLYAGVVGVVLGVDAAKNHSS